IGFGSGTLARPEPRQLAVVPAHNEAASLRAVVDELRALRPEVDILIVDDGSTDESVWFVGELGVRWLRFPERLGVGSAMRAGFRYATRLEYDVVIRVDGDGQHGAADIDALLAPILSGDADVVLGSRFTAPGGVRGRRAGLVQRPLAACLSALTGRRVT